PPPPLRRTGLPARADRQRPTWLWPLLHLKASTPSPPRIHSATLHRSKGARKGGLHPCRHFLAPMKWGRGGSGEARAGEGVSRHLPREPQVHLAAASPPPRSSQQLRPLPAPPLCRRAGRCPAPSDPPHRLPACFPASRPRRRRVRRWSSKPSRRR